ncbi:unnamed protein product [Lota lota]
MEQGAPSARLRGIKASTCDLGAGFAGPLRLLRTHLCPPLSVFTPRTTFTHPSIRSSFLVYRLRFALSCSSLLVARAPNVVHSFAPRLVLCVAV